MVVACTLEPSAKARHQQSPPARRAFVRMAHEGRRHGLRRCPGGAAHAGGAAHLHRRSNAGRRGTAHLHIRRRAAAHLRMRSTGHLLPP